MFERFDLQMNKAIVGAIAIMAIMAIITTSALDMYSIQNSNDSFAKKYSKNQATTQASNCGNNDVSTLPNKGGDGGTSCQNTNSQIQGDDNSVSLAEVHYDP